MGGDRYDDPLYDPEDDDADYMDDELDGFTTWDPFDDDEEDDDGDE